MKYRKKPIVIEAIHYRGRQDKGLLTEFLHGGSRLLCVDEEGRLVIETLEGYHRITNGDYIIKGVKGEFYPCKPDIFEMTYEPIDHVNNDVKKIVLTVEEARELIDLLSHAEDQRQQPYSYDACDELAQLLTNRIEQSTYEG